MNGTVFSFKSDLVSANTADTTVFFIPLDVYNTLQGTNATLGPHELLLYSPNAEYGGKAVTFGSNGVITYAVKETVSALNVEEYFTLRVNDTFYFIVPDDQAVRDIYDAMNTDGDWPGMSYYYGFDVKADGAAQTALADRLSTALAGKDTGGAAPLVSVSGTHPSVNVTSAEANKQMFLYLYGGLFFLGLFLGALFIMATVIIMYYKQMSEGYDDKKRFEIMQKVGLSREEVKKTIRSQVLTVFFLPLLAAAVHILAAFKMITKLLYLLNLTNVPLFALCTLGTFVVFAAVYAVVYGLTARTYYRIVS